MFNIGQKTLKDKLGVDVIARIQASVPKAYRVRDDAGVQLTARVMAKPGTDAVLPMTMAGTVFWPGGVDPGDVDDDVTQGLLSQRPMIFRDSDEEMQGRVSVLETAVDNAADHGSPPDCAKMPRDIVFCTLRNVFCQAFMGEATCTQNAFGDPGSFRGKGGADEALTWT